MNNTVFGILLQLLFLTIFSQTISIILSYISQKHKNKCIFKLAKSYVNYIILLYFYTNNLVSLYDEGIHYKKKSTIDYILS